MWKKKKSGKLHCRVTNVQSPETGTFSISGTEGKTINRPYPSGRWEITSRSPPTDAAIELTPSCACSHAKQQTWPCSSHDCTGSIHLTKAINSTVLWSRDIWGPLTWGNVNLKCFNSLKNNIWEIRVGGLNAKNDCCSGEAGGTLKWLASIT